MQLWTRPGEDSYRGRNSTLWRRDAWQSALPGREEHMLLTGPKLVLMHGSGKPLQWVLMVQCFQVFRADYWQAPAITDLVGSRMPSIDELL